MRDEETIQTKMFSANVIIVMISAYVILSLSKVIIAERMPTVGTFRSLGATKGMINRSEEHTSELQSRGQLVCRLLLEKKKNTYAVFCMKKKNSDLTRP